MRYGVRSEGSSALSLEHGTAYLSYAATWFVHSFAARLRSETLPALTPDQRHHWSFCLSGTGKEDLGTGDKLLVQTWYVMPEGDSGQDPPPSCRPSTGEEPRKDDVQQSRTTRIVLCPTVFPADLGPLKMQAIMWKPWLESHRGHDLRHMISSLKIAFVNWVFLST